MIVALFCVSLTSCEKEGNEESENDPPGTITVKIRNKDNGGNDFELFYERESVKISKANNFIWVKFYSNTIVRFVDVKHMGSGTVCI